MAAIPASCLKVKPLKDLEEIHAMLREFQQFEVVIGSSEETFKLAGFADSELDDLCEVHISRIPTKVSLAQLVRLCISLNDSGGPVSLVRLTLFISANGVSSGRATATYQNEEHAMSAELELNGAVLTDGGVKRHKIKTENYVLQTKSSNSQAQITWSPPSVSSDKPAEGQRLEPSEKSASVQVEAAAPGDDDKPSSESLVPALISTVPVALELTTPAESTPPLKSEEGLIATTEMGRRLYVANIPKNKTQPDILAYLQRHLSGVVDVVLYKYPGSSQNRGFCFVEFTSTKKAMVAKEAIVAIRPWGCEIVVDWADPEQEPAEHIMKNVKVLYVKNIAPPTTENDLRKAIEERGIEVERVKVIRDFGFVHFENRERAEAAMEACSELTLDGQTLKISWAKPPLNKHMREEVLRRRERRMRRVLALRYNGRAVYFTEPHLHEALADPSAFHFSGYSGNHGQGDY
ncbi:putative RNA-binding protein 46-like [Tropilaelaps mercedesae]|uniref:Putative RNA-binding protein 46-like n=1 Tax=Tropilaelaps mercedesae TaxID=418985 RepID=A0A1V9Y2H8_9ACAR|nr:putative RNA-binding protein 46-like [Tropilaelaps mercedesae]